MIKRLTIDEYAEQEQISKQQVYNRVSNGVVNKVRVKENGKAVIYIEFETDENSNLSSETSNNSSKSSENSSNSNNSNENSSQNSSQNSTFETFSSENSSNSNQEFINYLLSENADLKKQLAEKDLKIAEITDKLLTLLEQQQQITSQAQTLNVLDKPKEKGFIRRLFSGKKTLDN